MKKFLIFILIINTLFIPTIFWFIIYKMIFTASGIITLLTFIINEITLSILLLNEQSIDKRFIFLMKRENKLQAIEQMFASRRVDLDKLTDLVMRK